VVGGLRWSQSRTIHQVGNVQYLPVSDLVHLMPPAGSDSKGWQEAGCLRKVSLSSPKPNSKVTNELEKLLANMQDRVWPGSRVPDRARRERRGTRTGAMLDCLIRTLGAWLPGFPLAY
jgi:hypothetical protein